MRRITQAIVTALPLCVAANFAQAELIDRGGGLIYDTTLNITWLQNANPAAGSIYDDGWNPNDGRMSFQAAKTWAESYNYLDPVNGVTYSDWRLPQGFDMGAPGGPPGPNPWESSIGCNYSWNGADCGFNMSPLSSEIVHLFYVSLGNLGMYDTNGTYRGGFEGVDWGLVHTGPFLDFQRYMYWNAIVNPADPTQEWRHFYTTNGRMSWRLDDGDDVYAWAVADGDIANLAVSHAPEPETYAMLLAGLGMLGFVARRRKQKEKEER